MPRWIVLRERSKLRWGGDLRRHYILSTLASRSDALDVDGWSLAAIRKALPDGRRLPWTREPWIAAATMLGLDALEAVRGRACPFVMDYHDDPIAQNAALGLEADPAWTEQILRRKRAHIDAFRTFIVPSMPLAEIAELPLDRVIIAGNGTDTSLISPMPFPQAPAVGLMSGASTGRGIESLIEACRLVRTQVPELRLVLWLAATSVSSAAYLADLRTATAADGWIEYGSAPYAEIGRHLGQVTVQCVPQPASAYWDSVSPIKLFDSMASGRPVVVTPRTAMRTEVERHDAGLVARGDDPADLAEPLARILGDPGLAERLGANGRAAAEFEFDWRTIAADLALRLERVA